MFRHGPGTAVLVATVLVGCAPATRPPPASTPDATVPLDTLVPATDALPPADTSAVADGLFPMDATVPAVVSQGVVEYAVPGRTVRVSIVAPDVLRVQYLQGSTPWPDRGWTTVGPMPALPAVTAAASGDFLQVDTPVLTVSIHRATAGITVRDHAGHTLAEDLDDYPGTYTRTLTRTVTPTEHFYGAGEKTGPLDRRGARLTFWNSDVWGTQGGMFPPTADPLYQSVPFVISLRDGVASGTYLANTFRAVMDLGHTDPARFVYQTDGGDLDYWFLAGPDIAHVVQAFAALTGRPPLPPRWALGYHQSRWSYVPESSLRAVAAGLRSRDIPCDGLWLDIDHMNGFRSFTWDATAFPTPAATLHDLATQGFHVVDIIDPGIKVDPGRGYAVYDQAVAGAHLITDTTGAPFVGTVWPGAASFPDFTRAATRAWWGTWVGAPVRSGLAGAWIDMNEPTTFGTAGLPLDTPVNGEGVPTTLAEAHNVYALAMARATREGQLAAAPDARPFVLTRAGFAGIQRYAAVWTGDTMSTWDHLAMVPAMLAGMGLSGIALAGSDVGGYAGGPSPELFARWLEVGALSPFFRNHVQSGSPPQEPWAFGPDVEALSRAAIQLRYTLLPTLYAAVRESTVTGTPVLRPLVWDAQTDPVAATVSDQFMVGPALLAAPVLVQGVTTRTVYLPAGTWTDWWSGRTTTGPATVTVPAPLDRIPLFARANGVVAMGPVAASTGAIPTDAPVTLELFPVPGTPPFTWTLYQDDGASMAYTRGVYRAVPVTLSAATDGASLTLGPADGTFPPPESALVVRFHHVVATPTAVELGDAALPQVATETAIPPTGGWTWDTATHVVTARVPPQPMGTTLRCRYDTAVPVTRVVSVRVTVTLPAGTPMDATVYLASARQGWTPDGTRMNRTDATHAAATLAVEEGTDLAYKYTLGLWTAVETTATCGDVPNRTATVAYGTDGTVGLSDTVARWRTTCAP